MKWSIPKHAKELVHHTRAAHGIPRSSSPGEVLLHSGMREVRYYLGHTQYHGLGNVTRYMEVRVCKEQRSIPQAVISKARVVEGVFETPYCTVYP